eukprot:379193_1
MSRSKKFRRIFIYTGLFLVFCSLILSTIILAIIDDVEQPKPNQQLFIISNKAHNELTEKITIEFPFKWTWEYSHTQLESIYHMKNAHYDMNKLLFNHSFILNINWNIIEKISSLPRFKESDQSLLKVKFFDYLTQFDISTLPSIISWNFLHNTFPNLGYCASQFYPQLLYYHNGISEISYLRIDNVLLVKEPSFNSKQHNQLIIWIFVVNPYIYSDFSSTQFLNQSFYVSQLLEQTKYVLCVFNFKIGATNKAFTTLSQKIQRPLQFQDHYAIIKCKVPLAIYKYLDLMVKNKYIYTPFHVTLLDPYQLFYAQSNRVNVSYITVPICPNYVINNGMNIRSINIDLNRQYELETVPDLHSLTVLKQNGYLLKDKKHNLGACVVLHAIKGDLYSTQDRKQIIQKVHEWIEFSMDIVGVDHFYFYEHVSVYENDSDFMWNEILGPYYKIYGNKLITFIKWHKPFSIYFTFQ